MSWNTYGMKKGIGRLYTEIEIKNTTASRMAKGKRRQLEERRNQFFALRKVPQSQTENSFFKSQKDFVDRMVPLAT